MTDKWLEKKTEEEKVLFKIGWTLGRYFPDVQMEFIKKPDGSTHIRFGQNFDLVTFVKDGLKVYSKQEPSDD